MIAHFRATIADIRALPRPVHILVAGQFINRFGAFVFPFLTLFLLERGFTPGNVSLVLAAGGLGNFLGPLVGGYLADAIGRRNTIVLSLVGSAMMILLIYFCRSFALLLVVTFANGCLISAFGPATSALIADLVPNEKRVTAFALLRLAINAGFAAGPAVAGLLFTRAPFLIFAGDAATTIVFAALAWRQLPHGLRTVKGRTMSPRVAFASWRDAWRDMRQNLPFVQYLVAILFTAIAFDQIFSTLAVTATDRGLTPSAYGLVMGCNGLIIVVVELPLVQWLQRFPPRLMLAIGFATIGVGCAAFAFVSSFAGFIAAMLLFTIGEIIALPIGLAYSSNLAPGEYRGRYFGFRGMTWALASVCGSAGIWLYGELGAAWWIYAGALGLLGAGIILPNFRDRRVLVPG